MEDIKNAVLEYVTAEYLEDEDDKLEYDTPLITGGIIDSFSMVSLKKYIETKYNISIPDEKATPESFDTVNKIAELIQEFV